MWGCVRWDAVGRSVPSQAALPRPIPRHPRHRTCPRSPRSASVPRKLISEADPPSYPTSRGPTTPMGTNHDGHYREPRPRRRQLRRRQRATTRPRPYHHRHPGPHAVPATVPLLSPGPPEAPRSPAGRFCDQIRPRIPPPGGQPTPKGPPVAAGAEGSRTTRSGERSTAAPVGTGTTQPHTQLGAWGWFWLTP